MSKQTLKEINEQIADLKKQINEAEGTTCEVYARIVGYYRAVRNWNKGKRAEFDDRKLFEVEDRQTTENTQVVLDQSIHYELYTRQTCPNCPPVKTFMAQLSSSMNIEGVTIDVDTQSGISKAASNGVFSSPTVIFYDSNNKEVFRFHSVEELQKQFPTVQTKKTA